MEAAGLQLAVANEVLTGRLLYDPELIESLPTGRAFILIGMGHGRDVQEILCIGELAQDAVELRKGDVVQVTVERGLDGVVQALAIEPLRFAADAA